MRHAFVLASVLAACSAPVAEAPPERGLRYISIGADALATAQGVAQAEGGQLQLLEVSGEVAVLAFEAEHFDELSHAMHERHDRCGGFMVHDSLEEAREAVEPPAALDRGPIDYTLDRAPQVQATLAALDREAIRATIGELSSMRNRYYQSETGAAASTWLRDRWRSFTPRRDVTIELVDHGYAQRSVILTIPGTTRPDEVVVIGGHLDSIALGGKASHAPGADDDASGIATLSEVLRVLLAADYRPARTVKFMAYAAEEVGLRGSLAIAKDFKKRGVRVVGALQLDMTNHQGSDRDIWLMSDFTSAPQNTFLGTLIDTYVGATWGYDKCGYACSDHAAWTRAGYPASMPFESRMNDRNQAIHTKQDTLETSDANAAHALKFARLGAAFTIELAKGELGGPERAGIAAAPEPARDRSELVLLVLGALALAGAALTRVAGRPS